MFSSVLATPCSGAFEGRRDAAVLLATIPRIRRLFHSATLLRQRLTNASSCVLYSAAEAITPKRQAKALPYATLGILIVYGSSFYRCLTCQMISTSLLRYLQRYKL